MTRPPSATTPESNRRAGWAAIAAGILGIIGFVGVLLYLTTTPREILESDVLPEAGTVPLTSRLFLKGSDVAFILQALLMIPVARLLHALGQQRSSGASRAALTAVIVGFGSIALLRLLTLLNPQVAGILFMGPTGLVGAWLIVVNWLLAGRLSKGLRTVGTLAGIGFVIQSASFFFLGGLAVFTDGPQAYAHDTDFHAGNALGGIPAGILYPIWAILVGRKLLRTEGS